MKKSELRSIIKAIILEDIMDKTIKNPATGRDAKISSALSYDTDSEAYKKAKAVVGGKETSTQPNSDKDIASLFGGKLSRDSKAKLMAKFDKQAAKTEESLGLTNRDMTDKEIDALDTYASIDYKNINSYLRGTTPKIDKKLMNVISNIDNVFKKNKLSDDTTVFRGLSGADLLNDIQPGKTFTSKAYSSTSINPNTAHSFKRNDGFAMKINLKKGQPIAYIGGGEKEMLLPANTKFRIISHDVKNKIVEVEPILD
jgi:hypothetical protein